MAKDPRLLASSDQLTIDENNKRIIAMIEAVAGEAIYMIQFESNGGSTVTSQYKIAGQTVVEPEDPTLAEHEVGTANVVIVATGTGA